MFHLTLDTSRFDAAQMDMLKRVRNVKPPIRNFLLEFARDVADKWNDMTFSKLSGVAKVFRGAAIWRPVKAQYRRKDGTVVPAWGGVPRSQAKFAFMRGNKRVMTMSGSVKGKKRPSGQRVKPTSVVMKDTGEMMREFTATGVHFTADGRTGMLATNRPYAKYQNAMRPFNRFSRKDRERFQYWVRSWLDALIQARNAKAARP